MKQLLRGVSHPDCLLWSSFYLLTRCFPLFIDFSVMNSSGCSLRSVFFWDCRKCSPQSHHCSSGRINQVLNNLKKQKHTADDFVGSEYHPQPVLQFRQTPPSRWADVRFALGPQFFTKLEKLHVCAFSPGKGRASSCTCDLHPLTSDLLIADDSRPGRKTPKRPNAADVRSDLH